MTSTSIQTPVDDYLQQRQETAVERFALQQEQGCGPSKQDRYTSLMPTTAPREGEQYAFEVDLDVCSGCKACVAACHSLNGLDEEETWRDVGILIGETTQSPVLQHVTTACHHCLDPACLNACPVDAYEKDPVTGIVKHLDDQCFGCQYCILACPYDVPKYHGEKGIVRKCDLCSSRLASGEAPACAQACPHGAIAIRVVDTERVVEEAEMGQFLPGAPEPQQTLPTTSYKTSKAFPRNMRPGDYYALRPEQAHLPLVVMLVLTQLSVGAFLVGALVENLLVERVSSSFRILHTFSSLGFGMLALFASVFHLGRPQYAYRAVIGLGHSWLSREIVAFGLFAFLASLETGGACISPDGRSSGLSWQAGLEWSVVGVGLLGVMCSVMIYQCTRRTFWNGIDTTCKFFATAILLGIASSLLIFESPTTSAGGTAASHVPQKPLDELLWGLMLVTCFKLCFEARVFRHLWDRQHTQPKRSAVLMTGQLSNVTLARFACGILGGLWLPGLWLIQHGNSPTANSGLRDILMAGLIFLATLFGELLERYLFFTAVVRPKMPGSPSE